MGHLFTYLGLTVGCIQNHMGHMERREQYSKDITYGTNSEFGFDYLRDNGMATRKEDQVQRDYWYCIVDEVDSILIDEARTPLIISGPTDQTTDKYARARKIVPSLVLGEEIDAATDSKRAAELGLRSAHFAEADFIAVLNDDVALKSRTLPFLAGALMEDLYAPFIRTGNPLIVMDERSSELTKYAANSFLATKVSFMNDIANLCEKVGADVDLVRKGMGTDARIGMQFLFAGIGYGGSCFPKDVAALLNTSGSYGHELQILQSVEAVNKRQKQVIGEKIKMHFKGKVKGLTVALWGLAFKPNTDDVREAPSLTIIAALLKAGATVRAYDPEAVEEMKRKIGNTIKYFDNNYESLKGADALVLATEWSEYRNPHFPRIGAQVFKTLEIPSTLPTFDELLGRLNLHGYEAVEEIIAAEERLGSRRAITV